MVDFTVYLYHDDVLVQNPLQYLQGEQRVINDINFEGMVFDELYPIILRLVLVAPVTMFYKIWGHPMNVGLKPLASDEDVIQFVTTCFENKNEIDLYTEHNGYDVIDMIHNEVLLNDEVIECEHSDDEIDKLADVKDIMDFQTEGEEHVNIKKLTTDDPWLNKLVGLGNFIGHCDDPTPDLTCRFMEEVDNPDENIVEYKNKVKKDVSYPAWNPETPWNECEPILGMRFESHQQLKYMLTNYGVAHGYLWYMQNDMFKLLVYYGRDVSQGKCARKRGKKPIKKPVESDIEKEQTSSGKKKQFVKGESSKTSGKGSGSSKTSGKEDLDLADGKGLTIISDGHKGLIEAVGSWLSEIKSLDVEAYNWLVKRNPNTWCRAYFEMDRCTSAFENGISESFNSRILSARGKPIITMLEDIRIYLMQRAMKKKQRNWQVFSSGFQEVEVRKTDEAYGVNMNIRKCVCRMWELIGLPYAHAVAAYLHCNLEIGVRSKNWKPSVLPAPLPPIERKLPCRPRKQRIRHPSENDNEISRVGRVMHYHRCWEASHNKTNCTKPQVDKPANFYSETTNENTTNPDTTQFEVPNNEEQVPMFAEDPVLPKVVPQPNSTRGQSNTPRRGQSSTVKRGQSNTPRKGQTSTEHAINMDEEALRETLRPEEEDQRKNEEIKRENEEHDRAWEAYVDDYIEWNNDLENVCCKSRSSCCKSISSCYRFAEEKKKAMEKPVDYVLDEEVVVADEPQVTEDVQKKRKRQGKKPASDQPRIYYKQRGRSERIANQKKNLFDKNSIGSTPEKAFSIE
ncbi:hypothetical protein Tco_0492932 [Tanacetum coccineum]